MVKRKLSVIVLSVLLLMALVFTVACDVAGNVIDSVNSSTSSGTTDNVETSKGDATQLQLLNTNLKLTQEQIKSQIKAEYLLENNGYKDSDEIVAIVMMSGDSLIDTYNRYYSNEYQSVAQFANSADGKDYLASIVAEQNNLVKDLTQRGIAREVLYNYTTVTNAVAIKLSYGDLKEVEGTSGVKHAVLSNTYNLPQSTTSTGSSAVTNVVDVYPTGIFNSGSVDYTGKGTAVAILDSGFDLSHEVFATLPNCSDEQLLFTDSKISSLLGGTNAAKTTKDLDLYNVYYSKKIPFAYDYADKDYDVFPYDSEHGTHVAGVIGGQSETITGVAVDTQLVLMKVFPDLDDGGKTEDILAALEDAVLLEVDAINMSLGSSCGFSREVDEHHVNQVYDKINESGISLITAASNSYSSAFGGAQGNTNFVTNPDSGTVGSPSTYTPALSVASISGTKSKYLVANGNQVVFFNESNSVTAEPNDFFGELYEDLGMSQGEERTLEYVVVPGVGLKVNYNNIDVKGKIALVRRGDNTFEDKALQAKKAGAVACIIYNNIEGDILMSMGKTDHIPTISISKEDGTKLAERSSGTIKLSYKQQAGPFMSDFSSWGPTPSLQLKPEITAHGGDILSAVPGGGYDELSGTSMATPNLCGVVVLIRQFLKEKFPTYTWKQISNLTNQMLMSTATIALNEEGNPYSPRKQGAGLASLKNVVQTKAYLSVDGTDRTKIELGDDKNRTGRYVMEFNVVNLSDAQLTYDLSIVAMTESVSTSDETHVAEKATILGGTTNYSVTDGTLNGQTLTVEANKTAKVKVVYTLSDADKKMIDSLFPYGMYVEGFVKLDGGEQVDLNVPFLGFYGDWTQAPMFDKTYYEEQSEAHDGSIDEEDKLKADYFATTPYGSYFYNYIIPLGTYLYDIDTTMYDAIPASLDHIAISDTLGTIDGLSCIYGGLLRGAKEMHFTVTDKITGEVVWSHVDYNAEKAYSLGGEPIPYYAELKLNAQRYGLINNRQYEFTMEGLLDYGDGGATTNVRNSFSFDFYLDNEAPVIKEVSYEKEYDDNLEKDRYYITMTVYDNHYTQSITPIIFTSSSTYTFLSDDPIPVYSERGKDSVVRFEITDYLDDIFADQIITSSLAFSVDDYALNSNIYLCQLPGTRGEFKFTKDGSMDGTDLIILSMYEGEVVDITKYLATADETVDVNKDYLKHLVWDSSNDKVATVKDGQVKCITPGRATVSVYEQMDGNQAVLIINVKPLPENDDASSDTAVDEWEDSRIEKMRFTYFDTLFAYSRAAQSSEIGSTGDRNFISAYNSISFYPGEKIQLAYEIEPWYCADNYEVSFESTNPTSAIVDEEGVVTALKEGSTTIVMKVNGSNLRARINITVKSEFVIENRMLVAYKGLGGDVVIPDDEGILYIGAFAFCLYETEDSFELTEEDWDANKIPSSNTTITSIVIPEGVEEIQKYAFYNCTGLRSVQLPSSLKFIREYAFYNDTKLTDIDLSHTKTQVIGRSAFQDCTSLEQIDLSKIYAIGASAFDGCEKLQYANLTELRNTGEKAFQGCKALTTVDMSEHTKLSYAMFASAGLTEVDIYSKDCDIPVFCFTMCENLERVTIHNNIVEIGEGAFRDCYALEQVELNAVVERIGTQAFYGNTALIEFTLPNNPVVLGNYAFYECKNLKKLNFQANTVISQDDSVVSKDDVTSTGNLVLSSNNGYTFGTTNLTEFDVDANNTTYSTNAEGNLLLTDDGKTIALAATGYDFGDLVLEGYTKIAEGAFSGAKVTSVTINNAIEIDSYAFADCAKLTTVTLCQDQGTVIGNYAFADATTLSAVNNLSCARTIGSYAFNNTAVTEVVIGDDVVVGEGAFFQASKLTTVTIGDNSVFGLGAFQECISLTKVNMPQNGGVYFGKGCFANDEKLITIDLSKVKDTIADETFFGCVSLMVADLQNVKYVGNYAFADCDSLVTVNLPVVETIGEGAFSRQDSNHRGPVFSSIVLPNTLTSLGEGAFMGCGELTSIQLPESLQSIGKYAFAACMLLETVELPSTIQTIDQFAFAACEALSSINLQNVKVVEDYAFASCPALVSVNFDSLERVGEGAFASSSISGNVVANNLVEVGDYAFQSARFTIFTAPRLQKIGYCAFQLNKNLMHFTFSRFVEEIGTMAFNGCEGLQSFYFTLGNQDVDNGNINAYAKLVDGVLYTKMQSGDYQLASVPQALNTSILEVQEGTTRIDTYAGNQNKNIISIILPDSLRIIGNYAFHDYKNLETVEFKSVVAPVLENDYDPNAIVDVDDPGFDQLHNQFDLFGLELCYYNFIALVGTKNPVEMIVPSNSDIEGYDGLVYQVYFGKGRASNYVAMEKPLVEFLQLAYKLDEVSTITLAHEKLIDDAVTYYNSITQDATAYGYEKDEYDRLVDLVLGAKQDLAAIKLRSAGTKMQNLQKRINALPTTFSIGYLQELAALTKEINVLDLDQKALLDLQRYNALMASYNAYCDGLRQEVAPIATAGNAATAQLVVALVAATVFFSKKTLGL